MAKQVFVLGAGFSAAAGFPQQKELLRQVTEGLSIGTADLMGAPDRGTRHFLKLREKIVDFLAKVFAEPEQPLENVFTLLDEAIAKRTTFAGYSQLQLLELRDWWIRAILFCLHKTSEAHLLHANSPYERLAMWWMNERITAGLNDAPLAILSLNWDSLIEDSVFKVLHNTGGLGKADIDYCVYTTPLATSSWHMPSPKQKAAGRYNLKLLKLHGSATWLRCADSGLVYTGLGMKSPATNLYVNRRRSPFIREFPASVGDASGLYLEPYIITPTYAKVFDLPHIQTTWHNAYIELREAEEITFVGYSLPEADYSFRTLVLRAIRPSARIRVVLWGDSDNPPEAASSDRLRQSLAPYRYGRLFGQSRPKITFEGVQDWIRDLTTKSDLELEADLKAKFQPLGSIRRRDPLPRSGH